MRRGAALALLLGGAAAACGEARSERPAAAAKEASAPASSSAQPPAANVRWVPARAPEGIPLLEAAAEVVPAPDSEAAIAPPMPGLVEKVAVQVGDRVEAGAPIVTLRVAQAAEAAGRALAAGERLRAYERRLAQLGALRAEGLVRAAEIAELEVRAAEARGDRQMAQATLRAAGVRPGEIAALVESGGRIVLRAPAAGIVSALAARAGEARGPDDGPIARISGGGSRRVEARFAAPPLADASYEFVAASGARAPATFVAAAPAPEAASSFRAWFELPEALPARTPGRLRVAPPRGSVAVVASAIVREGEGAHLFVREGDRPRRVAVRVLAGDGADAVVSGPVRPGDLVAAEPRRLAAPEEEERP